MISNSRQIVQQMLHDFQTLIVYLTGSQAWAQTVYTAAQAATRPLSAATSALYVTVNLHRNPTQAQTSIH